MSLFLIMDKIEMFLLFVCLFSILNETVHFPFSREEGAAIDCGDQLHHLLCSCFGLLSSDLVRERQKEETHTQR